MAQGGCPVDLCYMKGRDRLAARVEGNPKRDFSNKRDLVSDIVGGPEGGLRHGAIQALLP